MVVDYFFKFLIVRKLHNSTMQAVKKELSDIFCEYGSLTSSGHIMTNAMLVNNSNSFYKNGASNTE